MNRPRTTCLVAMLASVALAVAQPAPAANSVADIVRQAHQEISDFQKAGGKNADLAHPAERWSRELWTWRDTSPGTPDAAKATTEAIRLLVYADRFAEVETRVDRIPADDPAWPGLTRVLLDSASRQKSYTYFFARLEFLLSNSHDATTRAAAEANLGRAFRKQGDLKKAEAAFRAAIDLAADSTPGKDAASQLYEMLHLTPGLPAPTFAATALGDVRLSLADYRSKPVVLVFWATYCADCLAEVPLLQQLHAKYRERGLEMVGVSLDDEPSKVEHFVAEKGIGWPQICDGQTDAGAIPKLYNVTGTPDLFVIDRAGNLVVRLESAKQLERYVAEVTASNDVRPRP